MILRHQCVFPKCFCLTDVEAQRKARRVMELLATARPRMHPSYHGLYFVQKPNSFMTLSSQVVLASQLAFQTSAASEARTRRALQSEFAQQRFWANAHAFLTAVAFIL